MDFSIHHAAISVIDMERSLAFYEQFGFRTALRWADQDAGVEIAHLALGGTFLEIFCYRDHAPAPESAASLATDLPRVGVKHVALRVPSIEQAKQFVESRGIASDIEICEGRTGVTYFFVTDPSGILLEFVEDHRGLETGPAGAAILPE